MIDNTEYLKRAIMLAKEGIRKGGGPFGAVITRDGKILSEAYNRVIPNRDPTAHAEILAIRLASERSGNHDLSGCTIYSSCEPCPMCLGAVYWAGIKKVVFSSTRKDAAKAGFSDDFIYNELLVDPGKRRITFCHFPDTGGDEVFKKWEEYEDRKQY